MASYDKTQGAIAQRDYDVLPEKPDFGFSRSHPLPGETYIEAF